MNEDHKAFNWGCLLTIIFVVIPNIFVYFLLPFHDEYGNLGVICLILASLLLISVIWFASIAYDLKGTKKVNDSLRQRLDIFVKDNNSLKSQLNVAVRRNSDLMSVIKTTSPFKIVSEMYADVATKVFDQCEKYLTFKPHPAYTAAEHVKEFKKKAKEYASHWKELEYKFNFIFSIFPELKQYVSEDDALLSLRNGTSLSEFQENYDHSQDYLSKEEWTKLSVNDRNQLALDRYKERNKSKWVIGMQYEMYIGYLLRTKGYKVVQFGIENGLEDLGRDIIAEKSVADSSTTTTYIIQCKNWSKDKEVHENVVCQLFGTTLEYKLQHKDKFTQNNLFGEVNNVQAVLVTTTKLSPIAEAFAQRLNVIVKIVPLGDYPMIKCNINLSTKEKIYHLPFDQQYYTAKIENPGEFYAWTVKEATAKGFRRAFKHNFG